VADADTPATWTIDEACNWLDPPIERRQLAELVKLLHVTPAGTRRQPLGRPAFTYDVAEIMRLHAALLPWLNGQRHTV
jgi:hypothetical protein